MTHTVIDTQWPWILSLCSTHLLSLFLKKRENEETGGGGEKEGGVGRTDGGLWGGEGEVKSVHQTCNLTGVKEHCSRCR